MSEFSEAVTNVVVDQAQQIADLKADLARLTEERDEIQKYCDIRESSIEKFNQAVNELFVLYESAKARAERAETENEALRKVIADVEDHALAAASGYNSVEVKFMLSEIAGMLRAAIKEGS